MKVAILNGKFYLCEDDRAFGWYGYEITPDAYDALKECDIDDNEVNLSNYEKELDENV